MGTRPPALSQIAVAVVFALSVFGFTLFVWKSFGGTVPLEPKGYEVQVLFGRDAAQLTSNASVRIAGVPVGRVVRTEPVGTRIRATIDLERRYAPLPADARAIVRAKTLLGETFIELTPGTKGRTPVPDGGTLPAGNVQAAEGLDDVLASFDAPTRQALKDFLGDVDTALDGRADDISAVLGNAAPAARDLRRTLDVLDAQRPALRALIRDSATTLQTIADREGDLRELVVAGDEVLDATADRNAQLTATIRELPGFLRDVRSFSGAVEDTAREAAPTLRTLRPVARQLRPSLQEAIRLGPSLQRLARGIDPVVTAARRGLPALTRVVDAARPLVGVLDRAGRDLVPVIRFVDAYREDLVAGAATVAAATNYTVPGPGGRPNRALRVLSPIWSEGLLGAEKRSPTNRYNPYHVPGGLGKIIDGPLASFSCKHTSNPANAQSAGAQAAPCLQSEPWTVDGRTSQFPRVEPLSK
ncbi:MCE family protein [Conexibacter sp. W3-3-2]|uniref:MlaD family protein n=1 Tax=Conexibacter sp. W3-3-2 TaxID=2675227 RepID=UPI0012B8BB8B|nr:MlaD family protein [Conexibacter sp. W3-3-2]MTD44387.1 MCE family protein [Conexibacter sp. W3-3-2]